MESAVQGPGASPAGRQVQGVPDAAGFVPADAHRTSKQPILSQLVAGKAAAPGAATAAKVEAEAAGAGPAAPATPVAPRPVAAVEQKSVHKGHQAPAQPAKLPAWPESSLGPDAADILPAEQMPPARAQAPERQELSTSTTDSGGADVSAREEGAGEGGLLAGIAAAAASTAAAAAETAGSAWEATKEAVGNAVGGSTSQDGAPAPAAPGPTPRPLAAEQEAVQEPGLVSKAAQAAGAAAIMAAGAAGEAVEKATEAVAAVAGDPTDEDEAPADKAQELERGPSELRAAGSLGPAQPSHAPATTQPSSNLSDVLAAKRAALASGAPIPKGPPAPARLAGEAPVVGVVPIAGRVVHAVGAAPAQQERPAVTAEPAGQAGEAAAPRGAAAGAGAHSKALTHGMDEDWISELVERLWPYIRQTAEDMAWQMLPDLLLQNKPSWLHDLSLRKFVLGTREPDIKNIKVFEDDNDIMDDVFIELELEWNSKQDIEIEIRALPDDMSKLIPDFIDRTLAKLLTLVVGVEGMRVNARVRVALRPLLMRLPIVGAVQVALVEQPTFDYTPTLGQGAAPLLPAIKAWLDNTIRDLALQPYVLPDHYFYPIDPGAEDLQRPVGVLLLEVAEARKVPKMDFFSASDAFVEAFVRSSQRHRTGVISSRHPRWGERFEMPVHVPEHQKLTLILWDYDPWSPNDEIGRCEVKVSELQPGPTRDIWLDVHSHSEEEQERMKHDLSAGERAMRDVAKPFVHHSAKKCQLRVQATFVKFSDEEEKLIARAARHGGMEGLLSSPDGHRIDPRLHNVLLSGKLAVKVHRAEQLSASSLFSRPSIKFVARLGGKEKESAAQKLSRRGCVEFTEELQLDVPGEARWDPQAVVELKLKEAGWFGGGTVGRLAFSLGDVIRMRHVRGGFRLNEGEGQAHISVDWQPYF